MPLTDRSGYGPIAPRTIQVFITPGSDTWTRPQGCTHIRVQLVGAGGGGAGYCEAGGAGGYSEKYINVQDIDSVALTIGSGGSRISYYAVAADGTSTSFGTHLSASGGFGANAHNSHEGGRGGLGSGGHVNLYGGKGSGHGDGMGSWGPNTGGASYFGGSHGRQHSNNNSQDDDRHCAWGAGGTGGDTDGGNPHGSNGNHGAIVVYEYYNS